MSLWHNGVATPRSQPIRAQYLDDLDWSNVLGQTVAVPGAVVVLVVFPPHVGAAHHPGPQAALGSLGQVQQGEEESEQQQQDLIIQQFQ